MIYDISRFAANLKMFRKLPEVALTQKELIAKTGNIKLNYLVKLETGKDTPGLDSVLLIAKALNIPASFFFLEDATRQYNEMQDNQTYQSMLQMGETQILLISEILYSFYKIYDDPFISTNGSDIKYLRKRAGISQEDLADKAGMLKQTLINNENAKIMPGMESLLSICNILKTPVDFFIRNQGSVFAAFANLFLLEGLKSLSKDQYTNLVDSVKVLIDSYM